MTLVINRRGPAGSGSLSLRLAGVKSMPKASINARLDMAVDARHLFSRIHNAGLDDVVKIGPVVGMMAETVRVFRAPWTSWEII